MVTVPLHLGHETWVHTCYSVTTPPACWEMLLSDIFCSPFSDSFLSHPPSFPSLHHLHPQPTLPSMLRHWGCCMKGKYGMFTERIFKKC